MRALIIGVLVAGSAGAAAAQGRGRGGGVIAVITLTTTAWTDGGQVPIKYSQAADEVSPPLSWSDPPTTTTSFVLIVHDVDATNANGDLLQWLVWNVPAASRGLREGVEQGPQLGDGTRQISQTGPYYRGPAAPASGPPHHYLFELYALDTMLEVAAVGASPAETRTAVVAAMAGHVRGKGTLVGVYKRQ